MLDILSLYQLLDFRLLNLDPGIIVNLQEKYQLRSSMPKRRRKAECIKLGDK
jgi:hypothetical protein